MIVNYTVTESTVNSSTILIEKTYGNKKVRLYLSIALHSSNNSVQKLNKSPNDKKTRWICSNTH